MQIRTLQKIIALLFVFISLSARAEFAYYNKVSTLGAGIGVAYDLTDAVVARLGYSFVNFSQTFHTEDMDYDGRVKLGGAEVTIDWFPFKGAFRFSGGIIFSRNDVILRGQLDDVVTLGGTEYKTSDLGRLDGRVKFQPVTPYFGLGWGNVLGQNGHFHFFIDGGVQYYGSPHVTLKGQCTDLGWQVAGSQCVAILQDVSRQESDLNYELKDYKWFPVLNAGISYRF